MSDKHLTLELVTPEKVAWSAPADFVVLPARGGEMGVLPGHQSFLVQLAAGEVRVTTGEEVKFFAVSGGFAEIKNDTVSLFAETAEDAGNIDAERAAQALEKAKAVIKPGLDPMQLAQMEAAVRRAQVRVRVSRRGGTPPPHVG
ncbi:MAG: ATP synthase F1 subunit epsilon [Elusimicrobia bacterium CG11_big_fil_rev_8_21_14_0_20_64_6]|nr:MAG: ATP synthase F1 subunit epsilon [Elusimicrobia bacterium CG11_big_fil_rev_8_21_14_0_20_64_6]